MDIFGRIVSHQHPRANDGFGLRRVPQAKALAIAVVQDFAEVNPLLFPRPLGLHDRLRLLLRLVEYPLGCGKRFNAMLVHK